MTDSDDTAVRLVSEDESAAATLVLLARIGSNVDLLAEVLSAYPDRHPQVWQSAAWAKDLKDLDLACARLRRCAHQLKQITEKMERKDAGAR